MTYQFETSDIDLVVRILDSAIAEQPDYLAAWQIVSVSDEFGNLSPDLRAEIDFIFAYELREDQRRAGDTYLQDPRLSLTRTRPMAETPSAAKKLWSAVCGRLQSHSINALVSDILLTTRSETKQVHAARTIKYYLSAATHEQIPSSQAALFLARANTISRERKLPEELSVRTTMNTLVEGFLKDGQAPNSILIILSSLATRPRTGEFGALEREVIRQGILAIGESSNTYADRATEILLRLATSEEEKICAKRWHVNQYIKYAQASEHGMRQMHIAEQAAQLAINYELNDMRDQAVLIMQSVDQESMGWESVSVEAPLSKNVFRYHLQKYRNACHWQHGLLIFLAGSSPSGSHAKNRSHVQGFGSSIREFVTRTSFGVHGLPERTNSDFIDEEVARYESFMLKATSGILALELEYIEERFKLPPAETISGWMEEELSSSKDLSRYFSESLATHISGRYSDSARLSIPLIELAARTLLQMIDEPIYRIQRGEAPGRFPALDFYVEALAKRDLDPDWVQALRMTLLSPGMNLRNLAAHGFTLDFSEQDSALLLRLAGMFCSMPLQSGEPELEEPVTLPRQKLRRKLGWVWS
ncbi:MULTISPECIES: hypothetical protein [Glutamicibacter]|uniref:hypothetical protein n=1 Tax=Glutamicibacter TaxID=1742989 RepID=UPI00332565FB